MIKYDKIITVSEFLEESIDIDIYDDYVDELGIAFCGPAKLTAYGLSIFQPIMDVKIRLVYSTCCYMYEYALLEINEYEDAEEKLHLAEMLFNGLAGYISESEYNKLFMED